MKMIVLETCFCAGYLNELAHHWRENITEKKLNKGDVVTFIENWSNLYGIWTRVRFNDLNYDIDPKYLKELK